MKQPSWAIVILAAVTASFATHLLSTKESPVKQVSAGDSSVQQMALSEKEKLPDVGIKITGVRVDNDGGFLVYSDVLNASDKVANALIAQFSIFDNRTTKEVFSGNYLVADGNHMALLRNVPLKYVLYMPTNNPFIQAGFLVKTNGHSAIKVTKVLTKADSENFQAKFPNVSEEDALRLIGVDGYLRFSPASEVPVDSPKTVTSE